MTTSIDHIHKILGWPSPDQIWTPLGSGPSVFARLAREKIGFAVSRLPEGELARVGVLSENPFSESSEAPIAIVCDFQREVSQRTLIEVHKLAWNFCRSPLLFTIEPSVLKAWTCWEPPATFDQGSEEATPLAELRFDPEGAKLLPESVAETFHWIRLVTGDVFNRYKDRFRSSQRADQVLLRNLEFVRDRLASMALNDDTVHDLLARLIFVQFLRQRTDRSGVPALDDTLLASLWKRGILSRCYSDIDKILEDKDDTYGLFRWLNEIFNGDLFPGKGATEEEREKEWRKEMSLVDVRHLRVLAEFVRGDLRMRDDQRCLWPLYSFDAIPLEFISSIYEEFVSKSSGAVGAHYTPGHVVDFVLDRVLPWGGREWNLKILDPACGSGIFLVKSFQRLVYRWRRSHEGLDPAGEILHDLLRDNFFGVDINPHAIRVASFSLYLAMCDEIDPRQYWEHVVFPRLRNYSLVHSDFFSSDLGLVAFEATQPAFDLIIGNAPWGKESLTEDASNWARQTEWPVVHKEIGTLFLAKAIGLALKGGTIAMLQHAGAILFHRSSTAMAFRRKLFSDVNVQEIVDLSALRHILFPNSASPVCLVTLSATPPDGKPVVYCHPTPADILEDEGRLVLEPYNVNFVDLQEAINDPWIWTVLAWGGRRDLALLKRLSSDAEEFLTLGELKKRFGWKGREGFKRGDRKKRKPELANGTYSVIAADNIEAFCVTGELLVNRDEEFHSRDSSADDVFKGPLLLITKAWRVSEGFRAAIFEGNAIFPASSVYGLHFPENERLLAEAACAIFNSFFAEWFLSLTSGRAASYRPEILAEELLRLPICRKNEVPDVLVGHKRISEWRSGEIVAKELLSLKEAEWALIEDFHNITLRDFRQPTKCIGRSRPSELELQEYCKTFIQVLMSGFGSGKRISATIFQEEGESSISVKLVAFHLGHVGRYDIIEASLNDSDLVDLLESKGRQFLAKQEEGEGNIFSQRVVRIFEDFDVFPRYEGRDLVPTVFFVKPDQLRYWSRSTALRDADSVAAEIVDAGSTGSEQSRYLM